MVDLFANEVMLLFSMCVSVVKQIGLRIPINLNVERLQEFIVVRLIDISPDFFLTSRDANKVVQTFSDER